MAYIRVLLFFAVSFSIVSCEEKKDSEGIDIEWVDGLPGDYSFVNNWDYGENIYKNEFGELVCDGLCDPLIEDMLENNGKIIPDSVERYYQLVDTTHYYRTIESESDFYEWLGTDYVEVERYPDNTVRCHTMYSVSTHCSLQMTITGDKCIPQVKLISVALPGTELFNCKDGFIKIDRPLWEKGILKAEFYFTFDDSSNPVENLWWKGKIYSQIK